MKKLINLADPKIVLIVKDAYINGNLIVCNAEIDYFDLWRSCWSLEDIEEDEK